MKNSNLLFFLLLGANISIAQNNKTTLEPYVKLDIGIMQAYSKQFVLFGQDNLSPTYFISSGVTLAHKLNFGLGAGLDGFAYDRILTYRFEAGYKFLPNSIISPKIDLEIGGHHGAFPSDYPIYIYRGFYGAGKLGLSFNFEFASNFEFNINAGYRKWNIVYQDPSQFPASVLKLNSLTTNLGITYVFKHEKN